jgi:L-amino acid N-acyltransferase YncA
MSEVPAGQFGRVVSQDAIAVREAHDADLDAIQAIYAHHVLHGTATFEELPPDVRELAIRRQAVRGAGLPYLVAQVDDRVVGYAYATLYRPRTAYRYTIEDSIYVAPAMVARGIGRALLSALIEHCERGPWRQMIAVVGGGQANAGSLALHRNLGFEMVGTLKAVGFKLGGWVDTALMQRPLGAGGETLPT